MTFDTLSRHLFSYIRPTVCFGDDVKVVVGHGQSAGKFLLAGKSISVSRLLYIIVPWDFKDQKCEVGNRLVSCCAQKGS